MCSQAGTLKNTFIKNDDNGNKIIIVAGTSTSPEIIRTDNGLSKCENVPGIYEESMRKNQRA